MKYYAGIGSRETPLNILGIMTTIGDVLETHMGYVLRSGGADGADSAFEAGVDDPDMKEIWVPWLGFNNHPSHLTPTDAAFDMASQFHPAWYRCSRRARALHARNCHQILGADLRTPVDFVICWTRDGGASGGTGQALRIAQHHCIPILNLYHTEIRERAMRFITPES